MIIYSTADNWITDNRFGTLADLVNEYSNSAQNIDDLSYAVAIGVDVGKNC